MATTLLNIASPEFSPSGVQTVLDRLTTTLYSLDSVRGQKLIDQFLHPPARLNFALHGRGVYFISNQCNLKCTYCKGLEASIVPPALDEFEQILRSWRGRQLRYLHLTGLEPTVSPCLLEYLTIAQKYGLAISMSTNGYQDFQQYLELVRRGLKYIAISLDAHNNTLAQQLGQKDHIYDRVSANIQGLIALKRAYDLKVVICLAVTNINFPLLPEIVADFLQKLHPDDIRLIPVAQEKFTEADRVSYAQTMQPQLLQLAADCYPFLRFRVQHFFDTRGLHNSSVEKCYVALDERTVGGQSVYPCNIYIRERGQPITSATDPEQNIKIWRWFLSHNSLNDPICAEYCCDVTREYNRLVDALLTACASQCLFQPPRMLDAILQEPPIQKIFQEIQRERLTALERHLKRTALNAGVLGEQLDWHILTRYYLMRAAVLHDIGKTHPEIQRLNVQPRFDAEEKRALRRHTDYGKELLDRLGYAVEGEIAWLHHDRQDGSGYHQIALQWPMAELIAVADSYTALTEDRNHRSAMSPSEAVATILAGKCGPFREPHLSALQTCHVDHRLF